MVIKLQETAFTRRRRDCEMKCLLPVRAVAALSAALNSKYLDCPLMSQFSKQKPAVQ